MRPREIADLAARHAPGRGAPAIELLRAGLVHETFRVRRDGARYALRVPAAEPVDLAFDRAWEARVLGQAAAAGLAPPTRYYSLEQGVLVVDWIEGRPWSVAEARLPANISRMAATLGRLHALPAPQPARTVSPAQWIDCYSAALGIQGSVSPALRRAAADRAAEAAGLARGERGLCHSDLHVLNVIDRGPPPGTQPAHSREQGSLVLLDFEYAHVSDPFWDLAGWSANNDFEPELAWALAEAYRGRPPTSSERSRLDLNRWLYDYVCLLWSELYLRRDADPEISARARLIEARLAGALG